MRCRYERDNRVLIYAGRFGDESDAHPPSPLYKILSAPSRILGTHNLEVLVSTLNVNVSSAVTSSATESSVDVVLVPKLQATSARGLPVPYPVHKTLILGEGLDTAIAYGRFTPDSTRDLGDMVKVAIELPPPEKYIDPRESSTTSAVNVGIGTEALTALRTSIKNSTTYERGWFKSGLPTLSKWVIQDLQPTEPIKPAHKALISSITDEVEANITREDTKQLTRLASATDQQIPTAMIGYLESWAEKSHTELRDQLNEAFASKNWRKLSWWKLFWRVDDVGMVTEEVLERRWLVDAEKEAIYLAGRMKQASFPEDVRHISVDVQEDAQSPTTGSESPPAEPTMEKPRVEVSTEIRAQQPWPALISSTRASLLTETIPPLQALAQRLVLTTLSTTSLSSALSALLYVSMSSLSLLEAGAVAALGLMFSLRRMQKVWEGTRETWQARVREEGRMTLKSTEDLVRLIVRRSKLGGQEADDGVAERRAAREAVEKVRDALRKMGE